VIRYADFQDSGQYECEATNGVGTAQTYSMDVQVQGKAVFSLIIYKLAVFGLA
jgi:hypothetical protein